MENPYVSIVILSSENCDRVVCDLKRQTFKDFEIIFATEAGIVKAMNIALQKARGEIFVRIDDDVTIYKNWLINLIKPFSNSKIGGVTGPTFVPKDRRKNRDSIRFAENPGWFIKWLYDNDPYAVAKIYRCGNPSYGSNFEERLYGLIGREPFDVDHLEGTNWAMRTNLIRHVGGFDSSFDGVAEWFDTDVEQKIKKIGYRLVYNPKAYLYHLLEKSGHYNDRFEGFGRIDNWIRYHRRHSKFHYKMLIFLTVWMGYFIWCRFRSLFQR